MQTNSNCRKLLVAAIIFTLMVSACQLQHIPGFGVIVQTSEPGSTGLNSNAKPRLNKINYAIDPRKKNKDESGDCLGKWKQWQKKNNPKFDDTKPYYLMFKDGYAGIDFDIATKEKIEKDDAKTAKDIEDGKTPKSKYTWLGQDLHDRILAGESMPDVWELVEPFLKTFGFPTSDDKVYIIQSGTGGLHYYVLVKYPKNFIMKPGSFVVTFQNISVDFKCGLNTTIDTQAGKKGQLVQGGIEQGGSLFYGLGTKWKDTNEYVVFKGSEDTIPIIDGWRVAWLLGKFNHQIAQIKLVDFIRGKIDVHGNSDAHKHELVIWKETMYALKQLGYTQNEVAKVLAKIPGYDQKKTQSQINAWWDKEFTDAKRAWAWIPADGEEPTETKSGKIEELNKPSGTAVEQLIAAGFAWLGVRGGKSGWWIQAISNTTIYIKVMFAEITSIARGIAMKIPIMTPSGKMVLPKHISEHKINEMLNELRDANFYSLEDFEPDRDLIHLKNGIYVLSERKFVTWANVGTELSGHQMKTFNWIPTNWNPDAPAIPKLDAALSLYFDAQDLKNFWIWVGICCTKRIDVKKALICDAPHGCAKSTLARMIFYAIGKKNVSSACTLYMLCEDPHGPASLIDKMIMYDDDIGKHSIKKLDMLKKLISSPEIPVDPKFIQPHDAWNVCHMWLLANNFPYIAGLTEDETAKFLLLTYRTQFENNPDHPDIKGFETQFLNDACAEYIIHHAIESYHEWVNAGEVFEGASPKEILDRWEAETDIVRGFTKTKCEVTGNSDDYISKDNFVEKLGEFSHEINWKLYFPDKAWITKNAGKYGFWDGRHQVDGKRDEVYLGIKFKNTITQNKRAADIAAINAELERKKKNKKKNTTKKTNKSFGDGQALDDDINEEYEKRHPHEEENFDPLE